MKINNLMVIVCGAALIASPSIIAATDAKKEVSNYQTMKNERLNSVETNVDNLLSQLTLEEKISLVHASGKFKVNSIDRLDIPELWLSDGPHGVRYEFKNDVWESAGRTDDFATYLPHLTSVASSWNIEMARLHGTVLGMEARDRGKDIILGPGVNLARTPLYGRNFEYMGEDPYLASVLVVPEVQAIQAQDVAANVKHYALNNQELNRTGVNAKPSERTLREVYLPVFESAVKNAGVYSIMGAYNQYDGTNANQSKHLVKEILKDEWGFDGVLLTDWNVDINTYDAAMNGLDLEMGTEAGGYDNYFFAKPLLKQIQQGKIPEAVLDDKVRRILRLMFRVGLMDKHRKIGARNTANHQSIARKIASEGIVLLKNENNVLPLNKTNTKNVLLIGPNTNKQHGLGGGSSEVKSPYEITPFQGIKNALSDSANITVMRARSKNLSPIAADYIASKHWTGTPAWHITTYQDKKQQQKLAESWLVNAHFQTQDKSNNQYVSMSADIKPLKTGKHTIKLQLEGSATLLINNKEVISGNRKTLSIIEHSITLEAGQEYNFTLNYHGQGEVMIAWDAPGDLFSSEAEYIAAAQKADTVIYFGGLSHGDDREAIDRSTMKLPGSQDEVITKLIEANPNTVVFMVAGSAVEMPWHKIAKTIVWGWYGGMEAGNAFADVLFGKVNPSGKLPITLPQKLEHTAPHMLADYNDKEVLYKEGIFIGHRWFDLKNIEPLFPFGHGLSYTNFSYSNMNLSKENFSGDDSLTVTVDIKNEGSVAGAEIVQLYISDIKSSVLRPKNELKGFAKVMLEPGEIKQVTLNLNTRDFAFWDEKTDDWLVEKGKFKVSISASSRDAKLQKLVTYH